MIKYNKETYGIFSLVSQIFELNEDTTNYRTDNYTHLQLMLCEENSLSVDTVINHGMVYLYYRFADGSSVKLVVIPPVLPKTKSKSNENA